MYARTTIVCALFAGAALSLAAAAPARAQAFVYPSFQAPRVTPREFNFGVGDADGATSLVFQWREAYGVRSQLSLDVGVGDIDTGVDDDNAFFIGGQYARQLAVARGDMPFNLLFTVGANFASYFDATLFRVPVGVSAGPRFPIEGALAITPYLHPRLVFANCSSCGGADDSDFGLEFDLGVDFEFNPAFSLRLSGGFAGNDTFTDDSFGVSLAWKPGRTAARSRR